MLVFQTELIKQPLNPSFFNSMSLPIAYPQLEFDIFLCMMLSNFVTFNSDFQSACALDRKYLKT